MSFSASRARRLQHDRNVARRRGARAERVDAPRDVSMRSVAAREPAVGRRRPRRRAARRTGGACMHLGGIHRFVLRREGIDRRRDDTESRSWHPTRRELFAREHVAVDVLRRTVAGTPTRMSDWALGVSTPTWHRHTTCAPALVTAPASPAVCGSCRMTMSPAPTRSQHVRGVVANRLVVVGVFGRAERAAIARRPVQVVVQPLRDLEEPAGRPRSRPTARRPQHPAPYASNVCRSSATPPPVAVEFTFSTVRPAQRRRTRGGRGLVEPSGAFGPDERSAAAQVRVL